MLIRTPHPFFSLEELHTQPLNFLILIVKLLFAALQVEVEQLCIFL